MSKTKPASLICQERGSNEPTCVAKRAKVGETGRKFGSDVDNGIAAVREKLMFDLQKAADKMKDAIFREADGGGGSSLGLNIDVMKPNVSPSRTTDNKSPRLRSGSVGVATAGASSSGEKRDRAKFSVPLGKREIEEDFMAILGQRPPRRPKKRPKLVQRNLDFWFHSSTACLKNVCISLP
nr:hypothetical protein CQW23_12315 [Ipomoea batatas]